MLQSLWTWNKLKLWGLPRPIGLCNRVICWIAILVFLGARWGFADDPQIERGKPNVLLDSAGNVLSLPEKVILLNPKMGRHRISPETEKIVREFLEDNPELKDVKVRLNQGALVGDFKRLIQNEKVEWYWRILGIPTTLISSLTGRLLGGDHYNPMTNTIHLYSDDPAVALHELGHAKDFAENPSKGLYAVGRILPPVALAQEYAASDHAIHYLRKKRDQKGELKAYNTLYPAYGTYVGGSSGVPYGNIIGAGVGHVAGAWQKHERQLGYRALKEARVGEKEIDSLDELGQSLIRSDRQSRDLLYGALVRDEK